MPLPPDGELLTQAAARQLLERAGQIDADSTRLADLRLAAREAGISEAAFEAALVEMRGKMEAQAVPARRSILRRLMLVLTAAGVLFVGASLLVIPRAVAPARNDLTDHEIVVQCLSMSEAQDIAQTVLRNPGNQVQISPGSRVLRIRATQAQMGLIESLFAKRAQSRGSCDNTPAGR